MRCCELITSDGYNLFHNKHDGDLDFEYNFITDDLSLILTEKDKITCKLQDFLQDKETPITLALYGVFAKKSYKHYYGGWKDSWIIEERTHYHLNSFMSFIKHSIMSRLKIGLDDDDSWVYEPIKNDILRFHVC